MNTTPNINLSTYTNDPNDKFNLMVTFNGNMNKIDQAVGSQNTQINVINATASTAVTTANSAVTTASEALSTANSKTSINDNVASNTETYSSNKIQQLLEEAGGAVIDDSTTSLDSTWSSSKINTQINTKASINDTTAGSTTTYSSNKINDLLDDIEPIPYTGNSDNTVSTYTASVTTVASDLKEAKTDLITIDTGGYYYLSCDTTNTGSTARKYCFSDLRCYRGSRLIFEIMKNQPKINYFGGSGSSFHIDLTSNIYYLPAGTEIRYEIFSDYFSGSSVTVKLHKIN